MLLPLVVSGGFSWAGVPADLLIRDRNLHTDLCKAALWQCLLLKALYKGNCIELHSSGVAGLILSLGYWWIGYSKLLLGVRECVNVCLCVCAWCPVMGWCHIQGVSRRPTANVPGIGWPRPRYDPDQDMMNKLEINGRWNIKEILSSVINIKCS